MAATAEITLRPVGESDGEFLFRVYASTRAEELAGVGWTEEQKRAFLRQQFAAQSADWERNYPEADLRVIEVDGVPVGRYYVNRGLQEIGLVDIALLPEYRRSGIGTGLIRGLLAEGKDRGLPVALHVEAFNPARGLYERLGFEAVADRGVYVLMRWQPAGVKGTIS